jgi:hypothetical protein
MDPAQPLSLSIAHILDRLSLHPRHWEIYRQPAFPEEPETPVGGSALRERRFPWIAPSHKDLRSVFLCRSARAWATNSGSKDLSRCLVIHPTHISCLSSRRRAAANQSRLFAANWAASPCRNPSRSVLPGCQRRHGVRLCLTCSCNLLIRLDLPNRYLIKH